MLNKNVNFGIRSVQDKSDFWKKLSKETKGEFKIIRTVSRDLDKLQLIVYYKETEIKFTETDTKPLFVECDFRNVANNFELEITKADKVEKFLSKFSNKIVLSGNERFDKSYLIKSKDKNSLSSIISDKEIIKLILSIDMFYLQIKVKKENKLSLILNVSREINTYDKLNSVYLLTKHLIDRIIILSKT